MTHTGRNAMPCRTWDTDRPLSLRRALPSPLLNGRVAKGASADVFLYELAHARSCPSAQIRTIQAFLKCLARGARHGRSTFDNAVLQGRRDGDVSMQTGQGRRSFVLSAARRCVPRHAVHVTERPRLRFSFATNAAAEASYSCVLIGLPTSLRHLTKKWPSGIIGMVQGGNSATHSVAECERGLF
jgi:hypothetical protein